MKKFLFVCAMLVMAMHVSAQLAWDTEFSQSDFNNAQTVISKTDNVKWSNGVLGYGAHLEIGKISLFSTFSDECVIALPQIGIADSLFFAWQGASGGTITVYQSADHTNWSQVFATEGNTIASAKSVAFPLSTSTKYLKFAATGNTAASISALKVTELIALSVSTDEWPFATAMVDDATATKNVTITWTNIVASISSTDSHFTASLETVGAKNEINQTTSLTISYLHNEAGVHSGAIVIAGEGREVRIAVSGTTNKYDQTLTWSQTLSECIATDHVAFNAFASSGLDVLYISSDSTIAEVSHGELVIHKAGELTITATQPGNYKFNATDSIAKTLTIHKADPMVSAQAGDIVYGQKLSECVLSETYGIVPGALTWQDIDADTILNAGDYTLSVLFVPENEGIYNTKVVPVALHVSKAPQVITWLEQDTALTVGIAVPTTAVLSSGLPITYAYTDCLLTIENGVIMPESEGQLTVVAYHAGNENYLPTTVIMHDFTISAPVVTAIDQLNPAQIKAATKYLHAGKVYLHYAGTVYDAQGKRVR